MKRIKKYYIKNSCLSKISVIFLLTVSPLLSYSNTYITTSNSSQQQDIYYLISNNIFNRIYAVSSDDFISPDINEINESYTYVSAEINFKMAGDVLQVFEADNGIPYVLPTGSSVVEKGESPAEEGESVIPLKDIRGFYRKQLPDIGATDYLIDDETSIYETISNHVKIYQYNQKLIIQSTEAIGKIEICDLAGKLIFSETSLSNRFESNFDLSGLYIVSVLGKHRETKKIFF